jgi:acyl carrier protein
MNNDNLENQVACIFRSVFDDPEIVIGDGTTSKDIDGWDSLAHVNLIIALEKELGIKFATAEISKLSNEGQNVGGLLKLIRSKLNR